MLIDLLMRQKTLLKSNFLGVYNLLEAILFYEKKNKKKIKLVHISTDEVYGDIKKQKDLMKAFLIILAHLIQLQKQVQII